MANSDEKDLCGKYASLNCGCSNTICLDQGQWSIQIRLPSEQRKLQRPVKAVLPNWDDMEQWHKTYTATSARTEQRLSLEGPCLALKTQSNSFWNFSARTHTHTRVTWKLLLQMQVLHQCIWWSGEASTPRMRATPYRWWWVSPVVPEWAKLNSASCYTQSSCLCWSCLPSWP